MPAIFYYGYGTQSHKRTARKAIKGERRRYGTQCDERKKGAAISEMWKPGCSRCKGSFQQVPAERRKDAGMRRKNVQGRRPYLQRRYLSPVIVPKAEVGGSGIIFCFFRLSPRCMG